MSTFLDALLVRSFSPSPPAIRPRPVARFELTDGDAPGAEERVTEAPATPRVSVRSDSREVQRETHGLADQMSPETGTRPAARTADVSREGERELPGPAERDVVDADTRKGEPPVVERTQREVQVRSVQATPVSHADEGVKTDAPMPLHPTTVQRVVDSRVEPIPPALLQVEAHRVLTRRLEAPASDAAGMDGAPTPAAPPDVQVEISIGRIELGAPRPPSLTPRPRSPLKPAVTLEEYLRRRDGGTR